MECWDCTAAIEPAEAFCPACRKIQPLGAAVDHFALLGVPRRHRLAAEELERCFRDRSRQLHPDRFARASPRERRLSLDRTTRLNDAFRTLKDDRRRADYLLRLAGHDPVAEARSLHDPEFLEAQLSTRERLAVARAEGDQATLRQIGEEAKAHLAELDREVAALFLEQEGGQDRHAEIVRRLSRARYYENIQSEAQGGGHVGCPTS